MTIALQMGDQIQARIWFTQAEQAAVCTFTWSVLSVSGLSVSDNDAARVIDTAVATLFKSIMSTDSSYRGTQLTVISRTPRPVAQSYVTNQGPGVEAPPDLPRQTAGLISWQTAFAGRRFRGRTYTPFPATGNNQTDGIPTSSYQTVLGNIANALFNLNTISNVGSTGSALVQMILLHRAGKSPTPQPSPVSGYIIRAKWATQRRRGSYGRANGSPI